MKQNLTPGGGDPRWYESLGGWLMLALVVYTIFLLLLDGAG